MSIWLPPEPGSAAAARRLGGEFAAGPPTLFLDRDGCLIHDRHYLADPAGVDLIDGVAEALHRAAAAGYQLIGLSNQSGIGRGCFSPAQLDAVMGRLHDLLAAAGARLDAMFYCPHAPEAGCDCRKPAPGLLYEAAVHFTWTSAASWVIGDKLADIDLALNNGLGAVLVRTGHGLREEIELLDRRARSEGDTADAGVRVVDDLPAAVELILAGLEP